MTDQERIIELRQAGLAIPAIAAVLNVTPEAVEAVEVGGGSLPGGSGARTFLYLGDGTGGTLAVPTGVAVASPSAGFYTQNGRCHRFGVVNVNLDVTQGPDIIAGATPLIAGIPVGFLPSALEDPDNGNNAGFGQAWPTVGAWPVGLSVLGADLYGQFPGGGGSSYPADATFPTTGLIPVYLGDGSWDVDGA